MKRLSFLSGGIDSVYKLYWELQNTDDEITAHRIHLKFNDNVDNASDSEKLACQVIVKELRKIRDFEYTESEEHENFAHLACAYYAKKQGKKFDLASTGRNAEDCGALGQRVKADLLRIYPNFVFPIEHLGKAHFITNLPKRLLNNIASCHFPIVNKTTWKPCGNCRPCIRLKNIKAFLDRGSDPQKLTEYIIKRKKLGLGDL